MTEPLVGGEPGDYFDFVARHLVAGVAMPLTSDEELHPLRMLLRAKEKMRAAKPAAAPARP
jgi:hypothetical protein